MQCAALSPGDAGSTPHAQKLQAALAGLVRSLQQLHLLYSTMGSEDEGPSSKPPAPGETHATAIGDARERPPPALPAGTGKAVSQQEQAAARPALAPVDAVMPLAQAVVRAVLHLSRGALPQVALVVPTAALSSAATLAGLMPTASSALLQHAQHARDPASPLFSWARAGPPSTSASPHQGEAGASSHGADAAQAGRESSYTRHSSSLAMAPHTGRSRAGSCSSSLLRKAGQLEFCWLLPPGLNAAAAAGPHPHPHRHSNGHAHVPQHGSAAVAAQQQHLPQLAKQHSFTNALFEEVEEGTENDRGGATAAAARRVVVGKEEQHKHEDEEEATLPSGGPIELGTTPHVKLVPMASLTQRNGGPGVPYSLLASSSSSVVGAGTVPGGSGTRLAALAGRGEWPPTAGEQSCAAEERPLVRRWRRVSMPAVHLERLSPSALRRLLPGTGGGTAGLTLARASPTTAALPMQSPVATAALAALAPGGPAMGEPHTLSAGHLADPVEGGKSGTPASTLTSEHAPMPKQQQQQGSGALLFPAMGLAGPGPAAPAAPSSMAGPGLQTLPQLGTALARQGRTSEGGAERSANPLPTAWVANPGGQGDDRSTAGGFWVLPEASEDLDSTDAWLAWREELDGEDEDTARPGAADSVSHASWLSTGRFNTDANHNATAGISNNDSSKTYSPRLPISGAGAAHSPGGSVATQAPPWDVWAQSFAPAASTAPPVQLVALTRAAPAPALGRVAAAAAVAATASDHARRSAEVSCGDARGGGGGSGAGGQGMVAAARPAPAASRGEAGAGSGLMSPHAGSSDLVLLHDSAGGGGSERGGSERGAVSLPALGTAGSGSVGASVPAWGAGAGASAARLTAWRSMPLGAEGEAQLLQEVTLWMTRATQAEQRALEARAAVQGALQQIALLEEAVVAGDEHEATLQAELEAGRAQFFRLLAFVHSALLLLVHSSRRALAMLRLVHGATVRLSAGVTMAPPAFKSGSKEVQRRRWSTAGDGGSCGPAAQAEATGRARVGRARRRVGCVRAHARGLHALLKQWLVASRAQLRALPVVQPAGSGAMVVARARGAGSAARLQTHSTGTFDEL